MGSRTPGREGPALNDLLQRFHQMAPLDLPRLLREVYPALGIADVTIYLADIQQTELIAVPDPVSASPPRLPIDTGTAGLAYRTVTPQIAAPEDEEEDEGEGVRLWLPLLDGVERIGVLGMDLPALDEGVLDHCRSLASLITLVLIDKTTYSDTFNSLQRVRPMRLPGELLWASLPPRTIGTDRATSSAVLEPAYDLGGDAFEHTIVENGALHAAVFDSMGHDLVSGLTTLVAVAAARHARRGGGGLDAVVSELDAELGHFFPDRHVTAVLAHLDLATGELAWANCGHPPPLLLRDGAVVPGALEGAPELPLGLGPFAASARRVHRARLRPGDRVLLYTDGVPEARSPGGELFGEERFTAFVLREIAAGELTPEVLRRLIHAILAHQRGRLTDDATILIFEWHPEHREGARLPSGA